ncbi:MAG: hypothetical protein ABII00_02475 [Elusimicrobiota bacterium]
MRKTAFVLMAALGAPAVFAAEAEAPKPPPGAVAPAPSPDYWSICLEDVKTDEELIRQGFFWMGDAKVVKRVTGRLAGHLACQGRAKRQKDPCKDLDRMQPAFRYEKEIGTLKSQCRWLNRYADFWWEMMRAKKRQRKFPACIAYLDSLVEPVKFFDVNAEAPRSESADPENAKEGTDEGKFWNVCSVLSKRFQAGKADVCRADPRIKYYKGKDVTDEKWDMVCAKVGRMWVKGEEDFCDWLKPHDENCRAEAAMTRAFLKLDHRACPQSGVEYGICSYYLKTKRSGGCRPVWETLVSDFCSERSKYGFDELPKNPKSAQEEPGKTPSETPKPSPKQRRRR